MNSKEFQDVLDEVLCKCTKTLGVKAGEYATDDRLHNFKIAAELQHCTPITALAGMMCKHTVSVYDLIQKHEQGEEISQAMWDEKIGDSINYLVLLSALIKEEKSANKGREYVNTDGLVSFDKPGFIDENKVFMDFNNAIRLYKEFQYVFPTREAVETILENAQSMISAYGKVSVEDFCDMAGIASDKIVNAGTTYWDDLTGAEVVKKKDGYSINLPNPKMSYRNKERTDKN